MTSFKFAKNIDNKGRWIRGILGGLLLGYAYWTLSWIVLVMALFVLFESLMSWCVFYQLLGRKSCPIQMRAFDECIFCQVAQKKREVEMVKQFASCFVIKDQYPVSPGHLLIIPYQHTENWFSAPDEVKREIVDILEEMKKTLELHYHPDGYNIGMNCGQAAGQTVMHLHVHLIPRYKDDMDDPKGGVRGVIPSKQKY